MPYDLSRIYKYTACTSDITFLAQSIAAGLFLVANGDFSMSTNSESVLEAACMLVRRSRRGSAYYRSNTCSRRLPIDVIMMVRRTEASVLRWVPQGAPE